MRRLILTSSALLACTSTKIVDPFDVSAGEAGLDGGLETSGGDDDPTSTGDVDPDPSDPTADPTMPELDESGDDASDEESTAEAPDVCGDGILGPNEPCDGDLFGDLTCVSNGFGGGELVCNDNCLGYSTDGCYTCGDGTIDGTEDCDGPLAGNISCESRGFTEGTIACDPVTCLFDTSDCSLCGNGVVEGDEPCDAADLGGSTCATVGFDGGVLACTADTCGWDYSGCQGGAYAQNFEGGTIPAEFTSSGVANWLTSMTDPIAGTWSATSGDINHSQQSGVVLSVTFDAAGTVEFWHQEDSESNYDYLQFYVDGAMQQQWSGVNAMAMASFNVAVGTHTLEWRYSKDSSVDVGSDRVWIDDLWITNGAP